MLSDRTQTGLLILVGLLLVTNPAWLFPHADDTQYTYERKQINIENGTLTYHGRSGTLFGGDYSDLVALGCQYHDPDSRACGFDAYLVTHGPVSTSNLKTTDFLSRQGPEFVHLDRGYYRRVYRHNASTGTYDVERVTPRDFLKAVAINFTGIQLDDLPASASVDRRLAVKGGTMTSFEDPEDDELGRIYRRDNVYYTVVVTDQESRDPPIPFSLGLRRLLQGIGILLLIGATLRLSHQLEWVSE